MGITRWITDLNTFNTAFNSLYLERNASYAEMGLTSVYMRRKDTDVLYNHMMKILDAHILIQEDSMAFKDVRAEINVLSKQYNDVLFLRKARGRFK